MPTSVQLRENRAQIWERMKQIVDTAEGENRDLSAEEQTNWEAANSDIAALDKRIERQEQLERTPAQRAEPRLALATMTNPAELRATREYTESFGRWIRGAESAEDRMLMAPATRTMNTTVGSAGAVAIPSTMQASIERALLDFGGMRSVATVMTTSDGGDLAYPISDDTSNTGEILSEGKQAASADATVGVKVFRAFMFSSKIIKVSLQLAQDASFDVEGFVSAILAERVARAQNTYFTLGSGANEPSGIVLDATSGVAGATGQTTTVTWDDLVDLEHSVGSAYRQGARYMLADSSVKVIRKLKDGEGRYLWQPGMPGAGGYPSTINGYPYTVNDDVAVMASNAKSILFGQLRKYLIRDVRPYSLVRFAEKYMDYLEIGFLGIARADGGLIDAGTHPVKYYANSAS